MNQPLAAGEGESGTGQADLGVRLPAVGQTTPSEMPLDLIMHLNLW
jgi:hypothetical protein